MTRAEVSRNLWVTLLEEARDAGAARTPDRLFRMTRRNAPRYTWIPLFLVSVLVVLWLRG